MDFAAIDARDLGFAHAALAVDAANAAALADLSPREAARARIKEAIEAGSSDEGKAALAAEVVKRRRGGGGFGGVHSTWLAEALLEEPVEVAEAVASALPDRAGRELVESLEAFGRKIQRRPGASGGMLADLEPVLIERFKARAFPDLAAADSSEKPAVKWLLAAASQPAGPDEIEAVAKELGLKVVVRAFSRIGREDLAKLCAGLASNDSVRLVSGVVELNKSLDAEALRDTQRVHLKILKAAGISRELFFDAGLAFLGAGLLSREGEPTRLGLAYRLPEPLGRRLLELSAPGAIPEQETCEKYAEELPAWLQEIAATGVAKSFPK